uniref:Secreted protein n=1 Tax=Sinocyclocheilus rhinocerous TaxID=307959 RepID=A0A673MG94_9TELE
MNILRKRLAPAVWLSTITKTLNNTSVNGRSPQRKPLLLKTVHFKCAKDKLVVSQICWNVPKILVNIHRAR